MRGLILTQHRSLARRHFTPTPTFLLALTVLHRACASALQLHLCSLTQPSFNECPLCAKFCGRYSGHEDEKDTLFVP